MTSDPRSNASVLLQHHPLNISIEVPQFEHPRTAPSRPSSPSEPSPPIPSGSSPPNTITLGPRAMQTKPRYPHRTNSRSSHKSPRSLRPAPYRTPASLVGDAIPSHPYLQSPPSSYPYLNSRVMRNPSKARSLSCRTRRTCEVPAHPRIRRGASR